MENCHHRPKLPADFQEGFERAIPFHGHLGPYLVFGLRMSLRARRELDWTDHFDILVEAGCGRETPRSCMADGLQVGCGATLGKGTIRLVEPGEDGVFARFQSGERALEMSLSPWARKSCEKIDSWRKAEEIARELEAIDDSKLFSWRKIAPFWEKKEVRG